MQAPSYLLEETILLTLWFSSNRDDWTSQFCEFL